MRILKPFMYCEPLRANKTNKELIQNFTVDREIKNRLIYEKTGKIIGLEQYLKQCAWSDDENNLVRVYLIKTYFSKEVIAYFALKTGLLSIDSDERDTAREFNAKQQGIKLVPDTISSIEISHFAVNDDYRKRHNNVKGLGQYIYPTFIYPIIRKISNLTGFKVIYLYAADNSEKDKKKLVSYYKDVFGFVDASNDTNRFIPVTSYYDDECVFMYHIL